MYQWLPLRARVVGAAAGLKILGYGLRPCLFCGVFDVGGQNTIHLRLFKIATSLRFARVPERLSQQKLSYS